MKTKKLLTFLAYAKQYISKFDKERSQLTYALQVKFLNKYKKFQEEIDERLRNKRDELDSIYCIKDKETGAFSEKEIVISGQVIFKKNFTPEGEKKKRIEYDKFEKEIFEEQVIDFSEYIVDIPTRIDITWIDEFTGFVFKEMTDEEKMSWYLSQTEPDKKDLKK